MNGITEIDLRDANAGDFDFLYKLHQATMKEYVTQTWGWDEARQKDHFRLDFNPSADRIIIFQGKDVGVLRVSETDSEVVLSKIEVLPDFQGRGIGTSVIREILENARRKRNPVVLQVLKVNPARDLYERLGFSVTNETQTHFLMRAEAS